MFFPGKKDILFIRGERISAGFANENVMCPSSLFEIKLSMLNRKLAFIASEWAGCTAAAFYAGTLWNGTSTLTEKARRQPTLREISGPGVNSRTAGPAATVVNTSGETRAVAVSTAVSDLTPEEAQARMKEISAIEDPEQRMAAYLEFIKGIKGSDQISAVIEAVTAINSKDREQFSMLMNRWAKEDPESALAWAGKYDDWRGKRGSQMALASWARTDPEGAVAWAQAHQPKDMSEGNYYLSSVVGTLAKTNLDLALQLTRNMEAGRARGDAMDGVMEQYFKQQGADAARTMVTGLPDGAYKNEILSRFAGLLASADATSAATWASTLPENDTKPRVMAKIIDQWSRQDLDSAGIWLNAMPQSAAMDEPRERFAYRVQESDPEAALAWAGAITDDNRRAETTFRLAKEWMKREPEAAKAWIAGSQMAGDIKERLINRRRG